MIVCACCGDSTKVGIVNCLACSGGPPPTWPPRPVVPLKGIGRAFDEAMAAVLAHEARVVISAFGPGAAQLDTWMPPLRPSIPPIEEPIEPPTRSWWKFWRGRG